MTRPTLTVTALKPNAPLAAAADLNMLVGISCPPAAPDVSGKRSRLNLSLAVDRSSSMSGKPLSEAKACVKRVIMALSVGDRVSVTAYDNRVTLPVPATEIGADRSALLRAVEGIEIGGSTDLHAGWLAAATEAASGLGPDVLTRVMVLSDGQTNSGIRDPLEIARQAAALADKGIATSTIGLGHNFNEDLMTSLAEAGQGQSTYGETADDLWPSFEAEFGLLSATCGKNVRLSMTSPCGGVITVENGFRSDVAGVWFLPNLAHGAEIAALVKVSVSGLAGESAGLLTASVTYDNIDGTPAAALSSDLSLPLVDFASFVIGASNAAVAERVKENEAANLQLQAKAAAATRNFAEVGAIADKMSVLAGDNLWIAGQAATMRQLADQGDAVLLTKEATYASSSLRTSYTSSAPGVVMADGPEFLKRRTRQGKAG